MGDLQSYYFGSESIFAPVCVVPGLESSLLPLLRDCYVYLIVENPFGSKTAVTSDIRLSVYMLSLACWSPPFYHYLALSHTSESWKSKTAFTSDISIHVVPGLPESSLLCPTTPVSLPPIYELQSHTLSMQYKIFTRRLVLFKVSHCCPCIWKKAILKVSFHQEGVTFKVIISSPTFN